MVNKPRRKFSLLFREHWINNWFDVGVDKLIEGLVQDTEKRYRSKILWISLSALVLQLQALFSQILETLNWWKQEQRSHMIGNSKQLQHGYF